jgi:aminopeptidase N
VAIGHFTETHDTTASGIPVRNYFAEGLDSRVTDPFENQPEMIDYFESVFGPYPFDVYGAVVHPVPLQFALEAQTLSVFGSTFINEMVVSHELSHMWFGDSVSPAQWRDIWLNEGFASYASVLWLEHQYGPQTADDEIRSYYLAILQSADGRTIPIADPGPQRMFDRAVYIRGALTLHALRYEIGEDAFFPLLREYYARYRDANASTADFIALAEEVSGQDLTDFFDGWLYQEELPDFPALELTNEAG